MSNGFKKLNFVQFEYRCFCSCNFLQFSGVLRDISRIIKLTFFNAWLLLMSESSLSVSIFLVASNIPCFASIGEFMHLPFLFFFADVIYLHFVILLFT